MLGGVDGLESLGCLSGVYIVAAISASSSDCVSVSSTAHHKKRSYQAADAS
jgi:hypothetical protein